MEGGRSSLWILPEWQIGQSCQLAKAREGTTEEELYLQRR